MSTEIQRRTVLRRILTPEPQDEGVALALRGNPHATDYRSAWFDGFAAGMIVAPYSQSRQLADDVWPAEARSAPFAIRLFGRFRCLTEGGSWSQLDSRKLQEVVAYLLLFRNRYHPREVLSKTLWESAQGGVARKNLRQSLWLLRDGPEDTARTPWLCSGKDWVKLDDRFVWSDVGEMESVFDQVRSVHGEHFTGEQTEQVERAVELYSGDLLEGWTPKWCELERVRLQAVYLALLEKLLASCEAAGAHEKGLDFGERLLAHDRAHERAHWRMMRLWYLSGDRTGALRQFERCRAALVEELGVGPGRLTTDLYELISADRLADIVTTSLSNGT